jgi:hypothetical protein
MSCERDFSKPEIYVGITAKNGREIKYKKELCPICREDDLIDTVFIFKEIKKRVAPLYEEKEYLLNIVCEIKNKLSDVDLSAWEA